MDETFLVSLLRIPGVGRGDARLIAERFSNLRALRSASLEEIEAVPGIGHALAEQLKAFAENAVMRAEDSPPRSPEADIPRSIKDVPETQPIAERGFAGTDSDEEDWLSGYGDLTLLRTDGRRDGRDPSHLEPPPPPPDADLEEAIPSHTDLCPTCGGSLALGDGPCKRCAAALVFSIDDSLEVELHPQPDKLSEARGQEYQTLKSPRINRNHLVERTDSGIRATGRVNGLAPRGTHPEGMTNGLVNGNGIRTRRERGYLSVPAGHWSRSRSFGGITLLVGILLIAPVVAILLYAPAPPGGIVIDGRFEDWAGVPRYDDTIGDAGLGLDISEYRIRQVDSHVLLYVRVSGNLWSVPDGQTESVFAFIDGDGDPATGFQIPGMGAETAAEFYGWGGALAGSQSWSYDEELGPSSDDWRSLRAGGGLSVSSASDQIEAHIVLGPGYDIDRVRILFHTWSSSAEGDVADGVVGRPTGALVVSQRTIAPEVLAGNQEPFLAFSVRPLASVMRLDSVTIRAYGSLPPSAVVGVLFLDQTGDGVIGPTDPMLSTSPFSPEGTFAVGRTLSSAESYVLRADFLGAAPGESVGFRVVAASSGVGAPVPTTIAIGNVSMAYLVTAPTNVTVDGAFADWNQFSLRTDPDGDVQSPSKALAVNENVDVREYGAVGGANVSLYVRVDGRILGGVDIPNFRERPPVVSPPADSDGDFVPDTIEEALGTVLPVDFNNDNVSDTDQFEDVDRDGIRDYNKCFSTDCAAYTDYFLETTIPVWYPPPYAGQTTRRYIGPISHPPQRGIDTVTVYVDRDNRTDTGLLIPVGGLLYGMDFAYEAVGRRGEVHEAALYAHNPSLSVPWQKVEDVPTAIDPGRLEAAFASSLVNLTAEHTFAFFATDWRFNADWGTPGAGMRSPPRLGTRSLRGSTGPPAVQDIPGNLPYYLRSGDHATETACSANKVASAVPGSGPAGSLTVGSGQSVCWYADATTGTTIPAGDWEALLDILVAHGLLAYTQTGTSNPRYREWNGMFGAEASMPPTNPGLEQWIVVAASPVSSEMIVGIVSDDNRLYVRTWSGSAWTADWDVSVGAPLSRRKFDIAFEGQSDNVLVVFGDATTQLKYRQRAGGTWSGTLNAGTPLADVPYWVRAAPRPTNDDVFVGAVTNAQTLHGMRWDGATDTFGDQVQMSGIVSTDVREPFDLAFERASGDAFVLWGSEVLELRAREFTTGWQTEAVAYALPSDARWVVADYDPRAASSGFAVGMVLDDGNFEFGAWDGAQWVTRPAAVLARDFGERGIDVAFERDTGQAIYAFNQNANPTQLAWRSWTAPGGFGGVVALPGATANLRFVQLRSNSHRNEIMALHHDTANDLFYRHWSGSSWSALGPALETTLTSGSQREPFMFAWTKVVEYDVHFEIWNMTSNTVRETIGSCLDRSTYGDDVQCLIPGVMAKTIAADEVVRIRMAHSSPGGTFLIQFDDLVPAPNSRATLPIPEFPIVLAPILALFIPLVIRRMHRRKRGKATRETNPPKPAWGACF